MLLNAVTLKNLYPLSAELNPVPVASFFCNPSTYISSSTENGAVLNPKIGVVKVQVAIPVAWLYCKLLTVDPLVLLMANISCVIDFNPLGATIISTFANELPIKSTPINAPEVSSCPVNGSTTTKSGIVV